MPLKIVLDAMGTDRAPAEDVRGAVEALQSTETDRFHLILVGKEDEINRERRKPAAMKAG